MSQGRTQAPTIAAIPTVVVRTGNLEQVVPFSGQTVAPRYAEIVVPVQRGRGRGQLNLVKLAAGGTRVHSGDVVAEVDPVNLIQQVDDFDDIVSQSEADLARGRAQESVEWESLLQAVRASKAYWDRAALDFKTLEVKSQIDREILRLNLDEAKARYEQQEQALDLKRISVDADLRILEINHERLERRRDHLAADLKKYTFLAPIDGMVVIGTLNRRGSSDSTQYRVGDQVEPGRRLLKVVDTAQMQVKGGINQAESSLIHVGQRATVSLDAFPGLTFPGKVHSVGALAERGRRESYYTRTVPVTLQIEGQDPRLIPDLTAGARVVVNQQENVLLLPREALFEESGRSHVYVKTANGFEKREVELGLLSNTHAAVESGLSEGDAVAVSQPSAALAGL